MGRGADQTRTRNGSVSLSMAIDATIGGANSDSYVTVAEFQSYVADYLGTDLSSKSTAELERYLRRATQLMHIWFTWRWVKAKTIQALDFPQIGIPGVKSDVIPIDVKRGQMEIANSLALGVDFTPVSAIGAVKKAKVKAGPVETDTEYVGAGNIPTIPSLDGLLNSYISSGTDQVQLIRG